MFRKGAGARTRLASVHEMLPHRQGTMAYSQQLKYVDVLLQPMKSVRQTELHKKKICKQNCLQHTEQQNYKSSQYGFPENRFQHNQERSPCALSDGLPVHLDEHSSRFKIAPFCSSDSLLVSEDASCKAKIAHRNAASLHVLM